MEKIPSSSPVLSEHIIAFADLRGYHHHICSRLDPGQIFEFLSAYYALAQKIMGPSNGRIVKFIGDSLLLSFPSDQPKASIGLLEKLKSEVDAFLGQAGYESRLCIKAHIGTVASGMLGVGELERYDICGLAVNQAALLPSGEWVISAELQEKIGN